MPRGRDDEGTRRDPQPCREPGVPSGAGRPADAHPDPVDGPTRRLQQAVGWPAEPDRPAADPVGEAESARLEMEQIEMARVDLAPIDLAALDADDELIEALALGSLSAEDLLPEPVGPDDELVAMLAAWVADVHAPADGAPAGGTPAAGITAGGITAAPDLDPAPEPARAAPVAGPVARAGAEVVALSAGADRPAWRPRVAAAAGRGRHRARNSPYATRLAAAAALVVMTSSGVLISARDAHPGEALWTISKVFYGERARSVEAAAATDDALKAAHLALQEGRTADAAQAIAMAAAQLPLVRSTEGHDELAAEHQQLITQLEAVWDGAITLNPTLDRRPVVPSGSTLPLAAGPVLAAPSTTAPSTTAPSAAAPTPVAAPTGTKDAAAAPTVDEAVTGASVVAQAQAALDPVPAAVSAAVENAVSAATEVGSGHVIIPARINSVSTPPPTDTPPDTSADTGTDGGTDTTPVEETPTEPPPVQTDSADDPGSGATDGSVDGQTDPQPTGSTGNGTGNGTGSTGTPGGSTDTDPPTTPLDVVPPAAQGDDPAPAAGDSTTGGSTTGGSTSEDPTTQIPIAQPVVTDPPADDPAPAATDPTPVDPTAQTVALPAVTPDASATQVLPVVDPAPSGRHAAPDDTGSADPDPTAEVPADTGASGRHAAPDPEVLV